MKTKGSDTADSSNPLVDSDIETAFGAIAEINGTRSRKTKQAILDKHRDNFYLREAFRLAYNWLLPFHIVPRAEWLDECLVESHTTAGRRWAKFIKLTELLSTRKRTGNAAVESCQHFFKRVTREEGEWYWRILAKDLKIGASVKTAVKTWPDLLPQFGCQLATKWEQQNPYPLIAEPKLDGIRILFVIKDGVPTAYSRNGKEYPNLQFLGDQFVEGGNVPKGVFDGEIFAESWNLTSSLIRKENLSDEDQEALHKIHYHVFDTVPLHHFLEMGSTIPQSRRRNRLEAVHASIVRNLPENNIRLVPQTIVHNEDEMMSCYQEFLGQGYEGVMLKTLEGLWEFKRTTAWTKVKPDMTLEGRIVGRTKGKGRHVGRLGAFIVQLEDGTKIHVGGGYSDKQRDEFWALGRKMQGKIMEFVVQADASSVASARFPVYRRIRDEADAVVD